MQESIINKKILNVMLSILLIGGAATLLRIYRSVKNTDNVPGYVMEEYDADIFV